MTQSKLTEGGARAARTSLSGARGTSHGLSVAAITNEERHRMIAEAAYFRAQRRGFQYGDALDDWIAAEREVDAVLLTARSLSAGSGANVTATKKRSDARGRTSRKS